MSELTRCVAEFRLVAERAWSRGLVSGSGGNLSTRIPGCDLILIKPTGVANIDCDEHSLLYVDRLGGVVAGRGEPSRDVDLHLAIYQCRPDVAGIVHSHAPWATSLTFLGYDELPLLTPQARDKLGRVVVVPYAPSGSAELRSAVEKAISDSSRKAVLLAEHGLITVGPTLRGAQEIAELVEESAHIATLLHLAAIVQPGQALAGESR